MRIHETMTREVNTVAPDTPIRDIAALMKSRDIGMVPVADGDRLVGTITDRDLVIRALADGVTDAAARDVMTGKVLYCYDDQPVEEVLDNLGRQQLHRLPVVNRDKRLVGIVSLGDLARHQSGSQEAVGQTVAQISAAPH